METRPAIEWLTWSTDAFAAARRSGRPLLLSIVTSWSSACRRFERDVLGDPSVVDRVRDGFIAVRVDADRRPDLAERYTLGGWPTLAGLTPDGEVLSGGTMTDVLRLTHALDALSAAFAARRAEIEALARTARRRRRAADDAAASTAAVDRDALAWLAAAMTAAFDRDWAGFGDGVKTPAVAPVAFALTHGLRAGDEALVDIAVRTLDRLGWSALSDAGTGAFNRACLARDWSAPDTARLLEVQADVAALFLDAAVLLGRDAYAERARAAIGYAIDVLGAPDGGFFNSQAEDDEGEPGIDRILVVSANARMVRTLLRAAEVLDDARLAHLAAAAVERLVPVAYASGAGLAHYVDDHPHVRGLLADQVDMSAALLDLGEAAGNRVYLELAEELMRSCLRKLWRPGVGFVDRLPTTSGGGDIGRLGDPVVPLAANCDAVRVLARLAAETGDATLRVRAVEALAAQTPAYRAHGILGADYGLALAELGEPSR